MKDIGHSSLSSHRDLQSVAIGILSSSPIGPLWLALSDIGVMIVDWSMTQSEFTLKLQKCFNKYSVYDKARTEEPLHQLSEYLHCSTKGESRGIGSSFPDRRGVAGRIPEAV